jgi:hypothetical protein
MIWRKKRQPNQSLPPCWTQSLWDEFKHNGYDFHCYLAINGFRVNAECGVTDLRIERRYFGFIGATPSTQKQLLKAELGFTDDRKSSQIHFRLPQDKPSAGWGQTDRTWGGRLSLSFVVFASLESQKEFHELLVQTKVFQADHLAISVWADEIKPWWDTNNESFTKVFSLRRVIVRAPPPDEYGL